MVPYIALFSWPIVSAILFGRYTKPVAVLVTILAGYLLLPERISFDLPLLPAVNKTSIPAMAAIVLALLMATKSKDTWTRLPGWIPRNGWLLTLMVMLLGGEFITVLMNSDGLRYGPVFLPPLRPYDAFSAVLFAILAILPLILGRKYFATPNAHLLILKGFCYAGLAYSVFILFELRMSPQLHNMVYGFFPHTFGQHARGGGWRPVVFLTHGLKLGIFLSFTVLAAVGLMKIDKKRRTFWMCSALWLFLMLAVSKNLGALGITILIAAVMLFSAMRIQIIFAAVIAAIFLCYPAARNAGWIPVDRVVEMAERISADRAHSLEYRLNNEDILLEKAKERPIFGWGGWGRSRVLNEDGRDISVTDGSWVITMGTSGWVGYVATYSAIALPLLFLLFRRRRLDIGPETMVLALIMAANLIDLIPNASVTPLTWLVAGALWGRMELGRVAAPVAQDDGNIDTRTDEAAGDRGPARGAPRGQRAPRPVDEPAYARRGTQPTYSRQFRK